ncbi:hypothetical protein M427DRAFT_69634 [Gonapodya prolifera JEL478]|uniref:BZIP domain-containing protein n=1 Tax=Gonapodya prolifera (strain JEL478) TaxID=1344416 RepID=A0A139AGM5_GONPJ|nr:hypothetical protein M427DRAFT_69634 [Gonapodya prolifera JEL478]|eukprot:KXS15937.1 hypothetical protein M427DRAFT_69634 [Gonapodya prolifera JEL478]
MIRNSAGLDDTSLYDSERESTHSARRGARPTRSGTADHIMDDDREAKRKAQNRAAQKAFRDRKDRYVRDLENSLRQSEERYQRLAAEFDVLQHENEMLRTRLGLSPTLPPNLPQPSPTTSTSGASCSSSFPNDDQMRTPTPQLPLPDEHRKFFPADSQSVLPPPDISQTLPPPLLATASRPNSMNSALPFPSAYAQEHGGGHPFSRSLPNMYCAPSPMGPPDPYNYSASGAPPIARPDLPRMSYPPSAMPPSNLNYSEPSRTGYAMNGSLEPYPKGVWPTPPPRWDMLAQNRAVPDTKYSEINGQPFVTLAPMSTLREDR